MRPGERWRRSRGTGQNVPPLGMPINGLIYLQQPVSGVALAVAQSVAEKAAKPKPKKLRVADDLKYTDNGNYFYQIHEILKAITRPALHAGYLPDIVIVNKNFAVNFVVFVDDLDRCLPEKAVQVLELIKTVFNVESFAFVLALDDEAVVRRLELQILRRVGHPDAVVQPAPRSPAHR